MFLMLQFIVCFKFMIHLYQFMSLMFCEITDVLTKQLLIEFSHVADKGKGKI